MNTKADLSNRIYFDLKGDDVFINFKDHLKENESLKRILLVQLQHRQVKIEMEEKNKEFKKNSRNLRNILLNL